MLDGWSDAAGRLHARALHRTLHRTLHWTHLQDAEAGRGEASRGGRAVGGVPRGAPTAAKGRRSKRRAEGKCAGGAPLLKRQPLRRPGASASGTPGKRGEPSPKPRDPRQRPWGSTRARERQGGQTSADGGRWFDGQRTKEQRGARTPAHAKVGGATVLPGLACSPLFAVYQTHRTHPTELGALPVTEEREPKVGGGSQKASRAAHAPERGSFRL